MPVQKRTLRLGIAAVAAIAIAIVVWPRGYCRSAKRRFGIVVESCPSGRPRQHVAIEGQNLRRDGVGRVSVSATALYAPGDDAAWSEAVVEELDVSLTLVDPAGAETAIHPAPKEKWEWLKGGVSTMVALPKVPDGDYLLRAKVKTGIGTDTVDLPLPLYAPARIHVLTDRPLYQPGNAVSFRALALRASDLSPIDARPGHWIVRSPSGAVMLDEKAPLGAWGVVAGDFPLDRQAEIGDWQVTWHSGNDEASRTFRVEPFSLPRFRVEATADRPFYGAREAPVVRGAVIYSSGAPVAGAHVEIHWSIAGADAGASWPPPPSWLQGGLPTRATTGANGRFELRLPEVPADLQGQARLVATLAAIDPAGDRVGGSAAVLLSADPIKVEAITELAGGLVAGFNNRLYLRVTTADGRPLPGTAVHIKKAWSGSDPGLDATLDEDAVARVQLDPGPPVNIVVPAMPVRAAPGPAVVRRLGAEDLTSGQPVSLEDLAALDGWEAALAGCAKWVTEGETQVRVALQVAASGAIDAIDAADGPLSACAAGVMRGRRLPAGPARLLTLTFQLDDAALPTIEAEQSSPIDPAATLDFLPLAMLDARDCVPRGDDGESSWTMSWQLVPGSRQPRTWWNRRGDMAPALVACLERSMARHALAQPATRGHIGLISFVVERATTEAAVASRAEPTIMQGYELLVTATASGRPVGETRLRMAPGTVPPLRLRATPVMARAGEPVTLELVRGPDFKGVVPEELIVDHVGVAEKLKLGADRTATLTLKPDARGWYEVRAADARALVYVRTDEELAVTVVPDAKAYPPGATAALGIHTSIGGKGAKAAVGLFGVDESLSQLVPLPGADDLGSLRPTIAMTESAFGVLDAQALTLGRIRGASAAEATVLRVASIPAPADLDVAVNGHAQGELDPLAEVTDHFYAVLAELHAQVRAWERTAPAKELMTPETMAKLWSKALAAAKAKKVPTVDAFGRELRLGVLPPELLALTDPRQVVVVGTRLPEDVENWAAWVARRKP